jgi:ABC-type lipoprotein release transport system permease subunit
VTLKNLLRRKIRTLLTVLGISIGVAAIVALSALAAGLETGYNAMLTGSKADLILSQPDTFDISYSSIDESVGAALLAAPEVAEVSGMIQGFTQAEGEPIFFVFGYPKDSFILGRFQIVDGVDLNSHEAQKARPKPILLGSSAAEVLDKNVGDTLRITGSAFRIVGIYQTGDIFEDSGAILDLSEAQVLVGKPRQVSLFYIRLKDPSLSQRFIKRVERLYPDLSLSGIQEFADQQSMSDMLRGYVWAIGGLAIVIGGVGMMNAQLMSVMERTREIGVFRAVGWSKMRVMWLILGESIAVSIIGGVIGVGLGWLLLYLLSRQTVLLGGGTSSINADLLIQAFSIVILLGLVGGLYPAWRASRMQPVEALQYEGGSSGGKVHRLPVGGMAAQSLAQRSARTFLTLSAIGLTVGSIIAIESVIRGVSEEFTNMFTGNNIEIMVRQADIADTSLSAVDDRTGDKIAAMPEVKSASGMIFTAVMMPEAGGFFIMQGYNPNEAAIQRFKIVEGNPLSGNHQIILGRTIADTLKLGVGDNLALSSSRYKIAGIFESGISWEELGGVISLRDAQSFAGRPRKSSMYAVKLNDPSQAEEVVTKINSQFPDVHAALAGDFVEQLPDMESSEAITNAISFLAILIGGVGVLNTMLMAVFERTREIGVLRALGWRRRAILSMILKEALLIGLLGGIAGIGTALLMIFMLQQVPMVGSYLTPIWDWEVFVRAIFIALMLGLLGGLYPAYRATRLQPVEALRYE